MAALLLFFLLRGLRSADISTAFVSASILPDFASVFTSLLSDLETDLELTDILFVLLREQIRSKPSTLDSWTGPFRKSRWTSFSVDLPRMSGEFVCEISMLYTFSATIIDIFSDN